MKTSTVKNIIQLVKQPNRLLTINENDNVVQAAIKMSDNHVGCLIVLDPQNKFAGVVTERDMLAKVITKSLSPDKLSVKDIMTTSVVSCSTDTPIAKIEQLMSEHSIRHIPIIENDFPVSMISSRDLIAYQLSSNKAMKNAAEQLALLPAGLKSIDFEDVVALAINEVPKRFNADKAVLCLTQQDTSLPVIYREGHPPVKETLVNPEKVTQLLKIDRIVFGKTCDDICSEMCSKCAATRDLPLGLIIPLGICDQFPPPSEGSVNTHGFLCMCWLNPDSVGEEELLLYKASLLQDVLTANLTNAKLYQNYQEALHDSETDPLTGLATRRVLEKVLQSECIRAERYSRRFTVAIVDVDNFKNINDSAGHAVGDNTLKLLAKTMRSNMRLSDALIARIGGDEFVLLMLETKLSGAKVLLERLRRYVKTISLPIVKSFTISCGLAEWNQGPPPDTAETILKRADDALYQAKHSGRNCVVTAYCSESPK